MSHVPPVQTVSSRIRNRIIPDDPVGPAVETKTDRVLEDRMLSFAGDEERVEALARARNFKRSWIELAETLARVHERNSW